MKQLQINKDSVTLEFEILAEGISAFFYLPDNCGGTEPMEMTFKVVDRDRSPWGHPGSMTKRIFLIVKRRECYADTEMWFWELCTRKHFAQILI